MDLRLIILWLVGICSFSNASFFGLFSSNQPSEPEIAVDKPIETKAETDQAAYENYLRFVSSTYDAYPRIQYVPIYYNQPQYLRHIWPLSEYTLPSDESQSIIFKDPIKVLPTSLYEVGQQNGRLEYTIPEAQMPTTLYDLPLSNTFQDFQTGGFVTTQLQYTFSRK